MANLIGGSVLRRTLFGTGVGAPLRLASTCCGLAGRCAVGKDFGDAQQRELLTMSPLAPRILAPTLLERDDLGSAALLYHFGSDRSAGDRRCAKTDVVAGEHQDLCQLNDVP